MLRIALMLALAGPWSLAIKAPETPLPCPAASSRARDRAVALPDGRAVTFDALGLPVRGELWTRRVACGADGRLAAAWIEQTASGNSRLRLALQLPGEAMREPITLARCQDTFDDVELSDAALAFSPGGKLLVTWAEVWRVRAVTISPRGERGETVTLGHASESSVLGAEIAGNGRAVVAWTTQDLGEERNTPHVIRAAMRAPGGLFEPSRVVDPGRVVDPDQYAHDPQSDLRLAVGRDGRAALLWGGLTEPRRYHYDHPVRFATASPTGGFGHWRTLAREGFPGDVAVSDDGTPLVVWMAHDNVLASVRPGAKPKVVNRVQPAEAFTATWLPDGRAEAGWLSPGGHHVALRKRP